MCLTKCAHFSVQCSFDGPHCGVVLSGRGSSRLGNQFATLEEAQLACIQTPDAGGISLEPVGDEADAATVFTLRAGTVLIPAKSGAARTWLRPSVFRDIETISKRRQAVMEVIAPTFSSFLQQNLVAGHLLAW